MAYDPHPPQPPSPKGGRGSVEPASLPGRGTYERPDARNDQGAAPTPIDVVAELAAWLGMWMRKNRQTRLPQPLLYTTTEAARFWLQVMYPKPAADPRQWEEDPDAPKAQAIWLAEARSALNGFLRLPETQRLTVVRMVQEEGIAYRGEPIAQYIQICVETELMREDPAAYKARALKAARRVFSGQAHHPQRTAP